jgi:hypothetical protein
MANRPAVNIINQLGVETVKGTAVPAIRKMTELSISLTPELQTKFFRAAGYKVDTTGVNQREWTKGKYDGVLSYNSIIYILESMFGSAAGGVATGSGFTWQYDPLSTGQNPNNKTFSIEHGDSIAVQKAAYAILNSCSFDFGTDDVKVSGEVLAQTLGAGAITTASVTEIATNPVTVNQLDIYVDPTAAALGTTRLTDCYNESVAFGPAYGPKFIHDTTFPSFKELIEMIISLKFSFEAEFSAQARALYLAAKAANLPHQFLRIKATGPLISVGVNNLIQIDLCGALESADENTGGLMDTYKFNFNAVHDVTWGKYCSIKVVNALATL